jgi:hypothetical protein
MRFQPSYWTINKSLIKNNDFISHHPILKNTHVPRIQSRSGKSAEASISKL